MPEEDVTNDDFFYSVGQSVGISTQVSALFPNSTLRMQTFILPTLNKDLSN
jgi:hypothetical protein